jgi:peptidoglycan/xylan/chitin deacetylase (PgdA/CDA1 family)
MDIIYYQYSDRDVNKIALTFDDGPNPFFTEKVLGILKENSVRATFFILGKWAELYPEIVEKICVDNHIVGNHSYSHEKGDFDLAETIITKATKQPSKFVRPPHNKTEWCINSEICKKPGVKIINNDTVIGDWKCPGEKILIDKTEEKTQNGSIILLHDGSHRDHELETRPQQMVSVLPSIIKKLKDKGFMFVGLDEMDLIPEHFSDIQDT